MTEHEIQNQIRLALTEYVIIFRANVGRGTTFDGRYFTTGLPKGFPDLFGVRRSDGRAVFIEVKTPTGKPSKEQLRFIEQMQKSHAVAFIAHSVDEAIEKIKKEV